MNNKAVRSNLFDEEKPPLLNLSDNRPKIDSTFRYLEHNNSPFINEMIMPLNEKSTGGKYVYDNDGNRYSIKDTYLVKNDTEQLFPVSNRSFKRTNVTSTMSQYHDYDIDDGEEAYTKWDSSTHSFNIKYKNINISSGVLFTNGVIVSSRIRVVDNHAIFVAVYTSGTPSKNFVYFFVTDGSAYNSSIKECKIYRQTILSSGDSWTNNISTITPKEFNPIINIAKLADGVYGFSVVNNYGSVLNTRYNGFHTEVYLESSNTFKEIKGSSHAQTDWSPYNSTSTVVITKHYDITFNLSYSYVRSTATLQAVSTNGSTYYEYNTGDTSLGSLITFPSGVIPTNTGTTVDIGGTTYSLYRYSKYKFVITFAQSVTSNRTGLESVNTNMYLYPNHSSSSMGYGWSNDPISYGTYTLTALRWTTEGTDFDIVDYFTSSSGILPRWNVQYVLNGTTYTTANQYFGNDTCNISVDFESTVENAKFITYPMVVCDNGKLYSMYGFKQNTDSWDNLIEDGNFIVESGTLDTWGPANFGVEAAEAYQVNGLNVLRNNSFVLNQNLIQQTVRVCNESCKAPASGNDDDEGARYTEYVNSNTFDLKYFPGTRSFSSFNYYGDYATNTPSSGYNEDFMIFTPVGMRAPVKDGSNWNILYNTLTDGSCLVQGLSWSSDSDHMGTLVAPWTSIDDDAYIIADEDFLIYRDKSGIWWKVETQEAEAPEITALLNDRYILVNTTSYINMYDSKTENKLHYATDYNGRLLFGSEETEEWAGYLDGTVIRYVRYTADGINPAYQVLPRNAISSIILPYQVRVRVKVADYVLNQCLVDEATQGVDVYYSDITGTTCYYRFTLYPYSYAVKSTKFDLENTYYSVASTSYISPNIFTEYINGAGNNDIAVETYDNYVLVYYNNQPYFLYTLNSQTSSVTSSIANTSSGNPYESQAFFVLQGQFYAIIDNKIYVVSYSNGSIDSMAAIVDCKGFKFIGNNPQIAFFWSPSLRAIYSFTGDAILTHMYDASKISSITGQFWYDETTQSIFIATDVGLLVLGPKNTYLIEDYKDVTNVQFTNDGVTHITNSGTTVDITYYPEDGFQPKPTKLATSFYGLGNTDSTSIDRWNITLFDNSGLKEKSYIKVRVISITDCITSSEEKELPITSNMYDKWGNSVLIAYNPKYIKGQGIRLEVETPLSIQSIVPHIMGNNSGTVTKREI